jgi:hypothetical protein
MVNFLHIIMSIDNLLSVLQKCEDARKDSCSEYVATSEQSKVATM